MPKLNFGLATCMVLATFALATPASATQWVMIDGTSERWWIDADSISPDKEKGVTFFTLAMSDQPGSPPASDRVQNDIGVVSQAIDCATGEQYTYGYAGGDEKHWAKESSDWPQAYWASVRRIVCKR